MDPKILQGIIMIAVTLIAFWVLTLIVGAGAWSFWKELLKAIPKEFQTKDGHYSMALGCLFAVFLLLTIFAPSLGGIVCDAFQITRIVLPQDVPLQLGIWLLFTFFLVDLILIIILLRFPPPAAR